ncbi:MAG: glycosyltransferase family 2 protein, partial [Tepidisphaeraceae bacterium]
MLPIPKVSFIISTRNRCGTLLDTLDRVRDCGLSTGEFDVFVVDNASTDGTADRVRETHGWVKLIALTKNKGAVAKNLALPNALGQYVVFLDD